MTDRFARSAAWRRGTAALVFACAVWLLAGAVARAGVDERVLEAEAQRVRAIDRARPSVVAIFAPGGQGGGSGVVISPDGYALSNFHVTGAGPALKCGLPDGGYYDAVIVGIDPTGDLALIKLLGRDDFPAATLGDSDAVQVGDWAFAMGNPFLLATDFQPTVTYGIVSGVHRYQYPAGTILEYTDCIQTDASINPGNSGGPLFDAEGRLIGINGRGSFEKRGRVNVGVGYAISINQAQNFLGHLKGGRIVDHATLGARVQTDPDGRVMVVDILEDSDAYRRGLRYGDEIVRFGERPIRSVNALKNVLGIYPEGWRVPLSYRRRGETHDVWVRLARVHAPSQLWELVSGPSGGRRQPPRLPERPQPERPQPDAPQPDAPQPDTPQPDAPQPDTPQPDTPQPERPQPDAPGADDSQADEAPDGDGPDNDSPDGDTESESDAESEADDDGLPPIVAQHYAARLGFANYYFNQLERERVVAAAARRGDFRSLAGKWTLTGQAADGSEFRIELDDDVATCRLAGGEYDVTDADELSDSLDPPGSGGLLAALLVWRRFLVAGPDAPGDLTYLGTFPLIGYPRPVDVLSTVTGGIECRLAFDPTSGDLLALELLVDDDTDPCEIDFGQYDEVTGRFLPRQLTVRRGDELYGTFQVEQWELLPREEP